MSSLPIAPPDGDSNRAAELNALAWSWFAISLTVVGLRFYSRLALTRNLWWDDWFILLTLMLALIFTSMWTYMSSLGGCRHLYYLEMDPVQAIKAIKINWITQPFTIMPLATGKISVAFLIMRFMGNSRWRRAFLIWPSMIGSTVFCGIAIILICAQCSPVEALWNPALVASGEAVCWPSYRLTDYALFTGSWLAFMDLALALLPITIIWNLQLDWHKKVGLSILMGFGVFAFICAVIKTTKLPELNARGDLTFITVSLWMWTANETHVIILAASIPTLRPLYLTVFNRPGGDHYRNKDFGQVSREGKTRTGRTAAPFGTSESTEVVEAVKVDSRLELGQSEREPETFMLDASSYFRSKDIDVEHTLIQQAGHTL